jgi:hypothetical protein
MKSFFLIVLVFINLISLENLSFAGVKDCSPNETSNAECLIQNMYMGNSSDGIFRNAMSDAINNLVLEIRETIEDKLISPDVIKKWFDHIADTRALVAKKSGAREASKYGLNLPESEIALEEFTLSAGYRSKYDFNRFRVIDVLGDPDNPSVETFIQPDESIPFYEGARHSCYFENANEVLTRHQTAQPLFYLNGK